jgi:hypothetical protein
MEAVVQPDAAPDRDARRGLSPDAVQLDAAPVDDMPAHPAAAAASADELAVMAAVAVLQQAHAVAALPADAAAVGALPRRGRQTHRVEQAPDGSDFQSRAPVAAVRAVAPESAVAAALVEPDLSSDLRRAAAALAERYVRALV